MALSAGCAASAPAAPEQSPPPLTFDTGVDANYGIDMVACLSAEGWEVTIGADRSVEAKNLGDQVPIFNEDVVTCEDDLGYGGPAPTLTTEQLSEIYPHVLWSTQCLRDAGYSPDNPPAEQSFIDGYTQNGVLWVPQEKLVANADPAELMEMFEKCPSPLQQ